LVTVSKKTRQAGARSINQSRKHDLRVKRSVRGLGERFMPGRCAYFDRARDGDRQRSHDRSNFRHRGSEALTGSQYQTPCTGN